MQVREAELYWSEVPRLQRRRTGGKARAQGKYFLWLRKLSQMQVYFRAQAHSREVHELWQRVYGGKESESWSGHRLPEQRVRLRAAGAGPGGDGSDDLESDWQSCNRVIVQFKIIWSSGCRLQNRPSAQFPKS